MIQYVGILGNRHSSYGLVDMRIHDISVVCDLSRRHPGTPDVPAPSEDPDQSNLSALDGTQKGCASSSLEIQAKTDFSQAKADLVQTSWSPGWPKLNFKVLDPLSTGTALIHFSIDLLNAIAIYAEDIALWIHDCINFVGDKAGYVISLLEEIFELGFDYLVIRYTMNMALSSWVLVDTVKMMDISTTVLLASIAGATIITAGLIGFLYAWSAAAIELFGLLFMLFPKLIPSLMNANRLLGLCWRFRDAGWGGNANIRKGIWYAAVSLVKVIAVIVAGYSLFYFYTLGVVMGGGE